MGDQYRLVDVGNSELLAGLSALVRQSNVLTAQVLAHLVELELRAPRREATLWHRSGTASGQEQRNSELHQAEFLYRAGQHTLNARRIGTWSTIHVQGRCSRDVGLIGEFGLAIERRGVFVTIHKDVTSRAPKMRGISVGRHTMSCLGALVRGNAARCEVHPVGYREARRCWIRSAPKKEKPSSELFGSPLGFDQPAR